MSESLAVRTAAVSTSVTIPDALVSPVRDVLDLFAARDRDGEILTAVRHFPAREAQWADFPSWTSANLRAAYQAKGVRRPYTHQAATAAAVHDEKNVVIVTPTASGKTLCYNLPVLNEILENPDTRAESFPPAVRSRRWPAATELAFAEPAGRIPPVPGPSWVKRSNRDHE